MQHPQAKHTIESAITYDIEAAFVGEVKRLVSAGTEPDAPVNIVFKVALENLAERFSVQPRHRKIAANLRRF